MRRVQLVGSIAIVACLVAGIGASDAVSAAPCGEALFLRILEESDAYDQRWLSSYSARFAARQVIWSNSGEMESDSTHEGSAVVDGSLVAASSVYTGPGGPALLKHQVADGELVATSLQAVSTAGQKTPPQISLAPGHGFGGDGDFPMLWMSVGNYLRLQFPHAPLGELLTGNLVQGPSYVMDGAPVSYTQRLTKASACEVSVDGAPMVRMSLAVEATVGTMSYSVAVECLVDPAKAYRLTRTQMTTDAEASAPLVDTITLSQNPDGVWYPSHVHGEYRRAWPTGLEGAPLSAGVTEKTRRFTEFTTRPDIPDNTFSAIPARGSAAHEAALRQAHAPIQ